MNQAFKALCVLSLALFSACQTDPPEPSTEVTGPDSLSYTITTIEERIACKNDGDESCLELNIEQLSIIGGASKAASYRINAALVEAINESDNTDNPNKSAQNIASSFIQEYQQILEEMPEYNSPWFYNMDFSVHLNNGLLLGAALTNSSYTGGAHSNSFTNYYTFDTQSGQSVSLFDLLLKTKYDRFLKTAQARFREIRGIDSTQSYSDAGLWFEDDKFQLTNNYRYSSNGLEFLYNPYDIAPYVEGPIELHFPYTEIESLIKPEYRLIRNDSL